MNSNNRLQSLPLEIFLEITKHLTIFDLESLESSGLFELNENGISDKIQAAFEHQTKINIEYKHHDDYDERVITTKILRCGPGLKMLKVKCRGWLDGFSGHGFLGRVNETFIRNLAARCPNIERVNVSDKGLGRYIRIIEDSKLTEIDPAYIPNDILPSVFNSNLKSLRISKMKDFIKAMEALNNSNPNFGSNIQHLRTFTFCLHNADLYVTKAISFFPNLQTILVKPKGYDAYIFNREKFNDPNFVYQFEDRQIDKSSVVRLAPKHRFTPAMYNQLENLQSLRLNGTGMMSDFSDYITDASLKSLKRLDFTGLTLDAAALVKFEKILSGRVFINSIVKSYSIDVHTVLIPLLARFCRNIQRVRIELIQRNLKNSDKRTVKLTAEEQELLNSTGIKKVFYVRQRGRWSITKPHKFNVLTKNV